MIAIEPNNYIKVSHNQAVVGLFPFNDTLLASASTAHRRAVELLDRTMVEAAEQDRQLANPRAPKSVVRMVLFRPCPCFDGVLQNHVGVWKCPKCLATYEECRC